MLAFYPELYIKYDFSDLVTSTRNIATDFVHTDKYKDSVLYEQGASIVSELPRGGWISKQNESKDFFVSGGTEEIERIGKRFEYIFPELTFTPSTLCYSSGDVPLHTDSPKNGKCSLVYPLHDSNAIGNVINKITDNRTSLVTYTTRAHTPIIINITYPHQVKNTEERIWYSIHFHEDIETVKEAFDKRSSVIVQLD